MAAKTVHQDGRRDENTTLVDTGQGVRASTGVDNDLTGVPDRIRRAREKKGWSLHRTATATGLSPEGVRKLELPGADPKLSTVLALARAFRVTPGELLGLSTGVDVAPGQTATPTKPKPAKDDYGTGIIGKGVFIAHEAINRLKDIRRDDPLRERGFQIVTDWCKANSSTGVDVAPPSRSGKHQTDEAEWRKMLSWVTRRKYSAVTKEEAGEKLGVSAGSARAKLDGAAESTGYIVKKKDDGRYEVRRAVHFAFGHGEQGEPPGFKEMILDLRALAVNGLMRFEDATTSSGWLRKEQGEFLHKIMKLIGPLAKAFPK
jgi:transcriptional regulator with XRE-family HTH domain